MRDGGYLKRLESDLARWRAAGDISTDQADKLLADARARAAKPAASFSNVAATLGAVLFGLGVITFIGANWDALPKLARLAAAVGLVWAGLLGAAYAFKRGADSLGHALALIGALCVGGAIAMVGQTYHIEGEPADLVFWWSIGALLTAAVFSSRPVLIAYAPIAFTYFALARPGVFHVFDGAGAAAPSPELFGLLYIPLWFAGAFLARRWDSGAAMHLSGLAALIWTGLLFIDTIWIGAARDFVLAGCMMAAFGAAVLGFSEAIRARTQSRAGAIALAWAAAIFFVGVVIAEIALQDRSGALALQMIFAAAVLGLAAWAMKWGDAPGRKGVRGFAVALFVFETFYVYVTLFKDMLDTAFFLLGGGAVLLGLAWGLRKFAGPGSSQKAAL